MKAILLIAVLVSIASSSDLTAQNASTAEPATTPTPTPLTIPKGVFSLTPADKAIARAGVLDNANVDGVTFGIAKPAPAGIMLLTGKLPLGKKDISSIKSKAFLDGVRIREDWRRAEPVAGTHDWSRIDAAIAVAQSAGRKTGLSVNAGSACPDWLFAEGCAYIQMAGSPSPGKLPISNDPHYIARWSQFVAALGARYDSNPTIAYIIIGGLGDHMEWYYGKDADKAAIVNMFGLANTLAMWTNQAKTFIDAYAAAFPTTAFIGALGSPFTGSASLQAEKDLVTWAVAKYPKRFGLSNSTLSAKSSTGFYPNAAVNANYLTQPTGFQMLCSATGDPARFGGTLDQGLSNGVNLHGRYVEIYSDDVANTALQPTIISHRTQLLAIPQP